MKHMTACLGLIASIALMPSWGYAQSTSGESVGLISAEGTTLAAEVSRDAKDYISVEIDGTTYRVSVAIAEGKTTKDIASVLHLSVKTAESHRSNIMNRLNVHNVASLVRYAIRHGMIEA